MLNYYFNTIYNDYSLGLDLTVEHGGYFINENVEMGYSDVIVRSRPLQYVSFILHSHAWTRMSYAIVLARFLNCYILSILMQR